MFETDGDSLFKGLDIAGASDNPGSLTPGTYRCYVESAIVRPTKRGDKVGLNLVYAVVGKTGQTILEWKHLPTPGELTSTNPEVRANAERALGYMKLRLKTLGIAESDMNTLKPEQILNLPVDVTIKEGNNNYPQVVKVQLVTDDDEGFDLNSSDDSRLDVFKG